MCKSYADQLRIRLRPHEPHFKTLDWTNINVIFCTRASKTNYILLLASFSILMLSFMSSAFSHLICPNCTPSYPGIRKKIWSWWYSICPFYVLNFFSINLAKLKFFYLRKRRKKNKMAYLDKGVITGRTFGPALDIWPTGGYRILIRGSVIRFNNLFGSNSLTNRVLNKIIKIISFIY
jgi:hypothetical protein